MRKRNEKRYRKQYETKDIRAENFFYVDIG